MSAPSSPFVATALLEFSTTSSSFLSTSTRRAAQGCLLRAHANATARAHARINWSDRASDAYRILGLTELQNLERRRASQDWGVWGGSSAMDGKNCVLRHRAARCQKNADQTPIRPWQDGVHEARPHLRLPNCSTAAASWKTAPGTVSRPTAIRSLCSESRLRLSRNGHALAHDRPIPGPSPADRQMGRRAQARKGGRSAWLRARIPPRRGRRRYSFVVARRSRDAERARRERVVASMRGPLTVRTPVMLWSGS